MNDLSVLIALHVVIAHLTGDWMLQDTWMATNKGKSIKALNVHVGTYTLSLCICFGLYHFINPIGILIWVLGNGALHWITDYFTSRWALRVGFGTTMFWKIIGMDQAIHYLTMFTSFYFLTKI